MSPLIGKPFSIFVAGAIAGAIGLSLFQASLLSPSAANSAAPATLRNMEQNGLTVRPLASPVEGFETWEISVPEQPEATTLLAVTAPGADGYIIGELFDKQGAPVSKDLLGNASIESMTYTDLAIRSQWLPGTAGNTSEPPVYLMTHLTTHKARMLWASASQSADQLPPIRIIPTPFTSVDGFESVLDVFTAPHDSGQGESSAERTLSYLRGERNVPLSIKEQTHPHPTAVSALSMNSNLHHQLRVDDEPVVFIAHGDGIKKQRFDEWLQARLGKS